ncbi:hypothetical protein [Phaeodactylibacter xiamenensis]|uniref:hypothetical protein n=1 Tax=Phaeodactylibacter xiamenensis TaxID=1524460 RepID=UPI003BAAE18A
MMLVFQVIGRLGSNSVSTSLRERRSSAIFPKRCNAGDQAASSELGLPGRGLGASSAGRGVFLGWSARRWLGGEQCRSVCLRVFTFRTYGTSRWLVLEVTYILPLWGIGDGWSSGGGRKAGVALEDGGWFFSVRRSFSGVGNLNLSLNLSLGGLAWC